MTQEEYTKKEKFLKEEIKRLAILVKHSETENERHEYVKMVNDLIFSVSKNISFALGDELEEIARNTANE